MPANEGNKLVEALHESGIDCASIVGTVESFSGPSGTVLQNRFIKIGFLLLNRYLITISLADS